MKFLIQQKIEAPVEKVFALLDDPEKRKTWSEGLQETRYTSMPEGSSPEGGSPVGTIFVDKVKEGGRTTEYEGKLTAYEKNRLLGVDIGNRHFTVHNLYTLSGEGKSCVLDYAGDMTTHTLLGKIMGFLFGWLTRKLARKQLNQLKARAESPD